LVVVAGVVALADQDGRNSVPVRKQAQVSQADSRRQSSSAGRVHSPLPSIRAQASRRSRAMPVVS